MSYQTFPARESDRFQYMDWKAEDTLTGSIKVEVDNVFPSHSFRRLSTRSSDHHRSFDPGGVTSRKDGIQRRYGEDDRAARGGGVESL
jgi:hypothetical protein